MRYLSFFLLTVSLLNFCQCAENPPEPSKLDILFTSSTLYEIIKYLEFPHRQLITVNKALNCILKGELSYKAFVSLQLNIPEIFSIPVGLETELLPIGALCKFNDPVHVFKAIRNDLIKLKRFPNLGRPLAKYLYRVYVNADEDDRLLLDPFQSLFDDLTAFLIDNCHFDLLIEFGMEESLKSFNGLISFEHTRSFLGHVASNETVRRFYIDCLWESNVRLLIKALIYNIKSGNNELFDLTFKIIRERISNTVIDDIERLIEFVQMMELFINIRETIITANYFSDIIKPKIGNRRQLADLAMMASLSDKRDLINELGTEPEMFAVLLDLLQDYRDESVLKAEDVKIFFDYYQNYETNLTFKRQFLMVLIKFYAFKSIKRENGRLLIVFKASEHLVSSGFPEELNFSLQNIQTDPNFANFFITMWDEMKINDLATFKEFFQSYLMLPTVSEPVNLIFINADVVSLFAQDEELFGLAKMAGIRLVLNGKSEGSILLQHPSLVTDLNRVLTITNKLALLVSAKNDDELRRVKEIVDEDVSEIILGHYSYDLLMELTENDYFELRLALKYWAKHQNSMNYALIGLESVLIIDLLERELS